MSDKLKSIKNPVVMVESEDGWKAIYVNGRVQEQADSFLHEDVIAHCLKNNCNIVRVDADHEDLESKGRFPDTFDGFSDSDIISFECAS